jgi:hypothetical protein
VTRLTALYGFLALLAAGCGSRAPKDWVAQVVSLSGEVRLVDNSGAVAPAANGRYLRVGSRLTTGPTGEAMLALRNGGALKVRPSSIVEFRSALPEKEINVRVEHGTVVGTGSQVEANELVIGVGQRRVRLASAAEATVSASATNSKVHVSFGEATVEGPSGRKETVIAGKAMELTGRANPPRPDAGPTTTPAGPTTLQAPEVIFYLQTTGKGRVLIRRPTDGRFVPVRVGETVKIVPGTRLRLLPRARVLVGPEKGSGTAVAGPAQFVVHQGADRTADGKPTVRLENTGGEIALSEQGQAGKTGSSFEVDGVKISTRITHRRLDVHVRRRQGHSLLSVGAGEAKLTPRHGSQLRVEAGQEATLSKGRATGTQTTTTGVIEARSGGTMRVFVSGASVPVTFRWPAAEGAKGTLVEVSRAPSMATPIFSDVIQRRQLTLPVGKGSLYWQVRPVSDGKPGAKTQGHLLLLDDTSHRSLKDRQAPKNTIHESFGNTTVYYQNLLPRFTFRWDSMGEGAAYQVKVFREQNVTQPIVTVNTKATTVTLAAGKLGEGVYLWYVAGRATDGTLIRASKSRRLQIRYDNATPDLQIVYPPSGATVSTDSIEAKGICIPGSKVSINGAKVELDETARFSQRVPLKAGVNHIIFLVVDPRRGSSYYLRQVIRR